MSVFQEDFKRDCNRAWMLLRHALTDQNNIWNYEAYFGKNKFESGDRS